MNTFNYIILNLINNVPKEIDLCNFAGSQTGFMFYVRQYPGYWQSMAHIFLPAISDSIPMTKLPIQSAVETVFNNVDYSAFFEKSPISDPNFFLRYLEMGIDPSIVQDAYKTPMISEVELDAFFNELTAQRVNYEPVKPLPLQVDGIIYRDRAEFEVAKAYFYYEASQYVWASSQYIDSIWQARINPNAPQEALLHYQSLTPELSEVYFQIWKEHFLTSKPETIREYLRQIDPDAFPPSFLEHCQYILNSTLEFFNLKSSNVEPPLPIYLSPNPIYPTHYAEILDLHCADTRCWLFERKHVVYCDDINCYVCNQAGQAIKLEHFWFPFILKVESQIFSTFKNLFPFFYEFIQYRVDFDPRFWRIGYYLLIFLGFFLHLYFAYLMWNIFWFLKRWKKYYTKKWLNWLGTIRTYDELKRAYKYWSLSDLVNDLIMVDFNIVKYIPKLLYNKRDIEIAKQKFLQFWKGIYRQYRKWKLPTRTIPINVRLPYIMSFWVYKIPAIKLLYNQLQALVIVLYIRRNLYILFISIFIFAFSILIRFIFIHLHIYRVTKYLLFFSLYHLIWFKMWVNWYLSFFVIRLCVKWYNWLAFILFLDGHVLAYPLFNFWPTYINSFEIDTYKDAPRLYPTSLKTIIHWILPMKYSNMNASNFTISWMWSFIVLVLNYIFILPLGLFIEKAVRLIFLLGLKSFNLYFGVLIFYRKILAMALLGDIISFSIRLKKLLFYCLLLVLIFLLKYFFLLLFIIFAIYFFLFYSAARLKLNALSYLQQLFNFCIIVIGGIVIYSWELFRFCVVIFIYIFLTIFFRLRYIFAICILVYLGVTTNFFYFLICRALSDLEDFVLGWCLPFSKGYWLTLGFPIRQWWVPPFEAAVPIPELFYAPSRWVRRLASILTPPEYLWMQPIWNRKLGAFAHWFPSLFPTWFQVWFRAHWPGPMLLRPHISWSNWYCIELRYSELLLYTVKSYHINLSQWLWDHKIYWIRSQLFTHNNLAWYSYTLWKAVVNKCPALFFDMRLRTTVSEFIYRFIAVSFEFYTEIWRVPLADSALTFLNCYNVKFIWRFMGIYYWLKFNLLFFYPYKFLFNWWYLMPSLCGHLLARIYYLYWLPFWFALPISLNKIIVIWSYLIDIIVSWFLFWVWDISYRCYVLALHVLYIFCIAYHLSSVIAFWEFLIYGFLPALSDFSYLLWDIADLGWYWDEWLFTCRFALLFYNGAHSVADYIFAPVRIHYLDTAQKLSIFDTPRNSVKNSLLSWRRRYRVLLIVARLFGSVSWHDVILSPAPLYFSLYYDFLGDELEWECWDVSVVGLWNVIIKLQLSFLISSFVWALAVWVLVHSLFFSEVDYIPYYNNNYLWYKFRSSAIKDPYLWLDRNTTVEVLDYYVDKFSQFDAVFDKQAEMAEDMPITLKGSRPFQGAVPQTPLNEVLTSIYEKRLAIRQYKTMLYQDLQAFRNTDISANYLKKRRQERRNLRFAARNFFLQKFMLINIMRAKFGYTKLDSSIISNFENAIEFDYNSYFMDQRYSYFYRHGWYTDSTLAVLIARGYRRDNYIKHIALNNLQYIDNEMPLDVLANQERLEQFFVLSKTVVSLFERFVSQFNIALPRYCWFMDGNIDLFFKPGSKAHLGQEWYLIEGDGDAGDIGFLIFTMFFYFCLVLIRLHFGMKGWREVRNSMNDLFYWYRVVFGNRFSLFNWLSDTYWSHGQMYYQTMQTIPTGDIHKGKKEIYGYWQWIHIDPLGKHARASTKGTRYLFWGDRNCTTLSLIVKSYWLCFLDAMWCPVQFNLKAIQIITKYISIFIYIFVIFWWAIKAYKSKDIITFGILTQPVSTLDWQNLAHIKAFYNLYSPKWRNYFNSIKFGK